MRSTARVTDTLAAVVSTLEGGYALSALGRSAVEHIRELVAA